MPAMTPLEHAIACAEAGRLDEARVLLRQVAADPPTSRLGFDQAAEARFSLLCDLLALPDDFPPRARATLVRGIASGKVRDAALAVRNPLGDDPDSGPARAAIRLHAPLLHQLVEGDSSVLAAGGGSGGRGAEDDQRWTSLGCAVILLGFGLMRACADLG